MLKAFWVPLICHKNLGFYLWGKITFEVIVYNLFLIATWVTGYACELAYFCNLWKDEFVSNSSLFFSILLYLPVLQGLSWANLYCFSEDIILVGWCWKPLYYIIITICNSEILFCVDFNVVPITCVLWCCQKPAVLDLCSPTGDWNVFIGSLEQSFWFSFIQKVT